MDSSRLVYIFSMIAVVYSASNVKVLERPKHISEEMYCLGCQVTVKELDFMLSRKPTRGMGETVTRALKQVCNLSNFKKYDFDAKKILDVCNYIKGDEGMEAVLITEYGRKYNLGKKTTYLDMTQMICGTVIKACGDTIQEDLARDGGIGYDPETEEFTIRDGKKVRYAKPVSAIPVSAKQVPKATTPDPEDLLSQTAHGSHDEL